MPSTTRSTGASTTDVSRALSSPLRGRGDLEADFHFLSLRGFPGSEIATCNRLTPQLAQEIKAFLNQYKLEEMAVHPDSRIKFVSSLLVPFFTLNLQSRTLSDLQHSSPPLISLSLQHAVLRISIKLVTTILPLQHPDLLASTSLRHSLSRPIPYHESPAPLPVPFHTLPS